MSFTRSFGYLLISMIVATAAGPAAAQIPISDVFGLHAMRYNLDANYVLVNDIDASATANPSWPHGGSSGWAPLGEIDAPFTGTLDGAGFTVTGLYLNRTGYYLGLFGVTRNATITDLHLVDVEILGGSFAGGMVGWAEGTQTPRFEGCSVSGSVWGYAEVGGFVGAAAQDVEFIDCHTSGSLNGSLLADFKHSGGFVGWARNGTTYTNCTSEVRNNSWTAGEGMGTRIGGFVGWVEGTPEFTDCAALDDVLGIAEVGGFAGILMETSSPNFTRCYSTGTVIGALNEDGKIGGFVGYNNAAGGTMESCWSSGMAVTGDGWHVGGFAGMISGPATTRWCYSIGEVYGEHYVGGFVGTVSDGALIERCYSAGTVYTMRFDGTAGGFVGKTEQGGPVEIEDCYATGPVIATGTAGGFVGKNGARIRRCYSTGALDCPFTIGGFVGEHGAGGIVSNSYWDVETSGTSSSAEGIGLTTEEMMQEASFSGWDFGGIWCISEGWTYPSLLDFDDSDGDGVVDGCDICPGYDDGLDADGDGVPDDCDICPGYDDTLDADGDGLPDGCDMCYGDNASGDTDGDGVCDDTDACPGSDDTLDDDGDGVPDGCDICPASHDGADLDQDGVPDCCDVCPRPDDTIHTDGATVPHGCDICPGHDDRLDADGDGLPDGCDTCYGNNASGDSDADGVCDDSDACP
ncbi:MAG: hypothetical protein GY842_24790, partial [bacterium]|nr:hypothetical protein [bacterium]